MKNKQHIPRHPTDIEESEKLSDEAMTPQPEEAGNVALLGQLGKQTDEIQEKVVAHAETVNELTHGMGDKPARDSSWKAVEATWRKANPKATGKFGDLAPGYRAQLWKEAAGR